MGGASGGVGKTVGGMFGAGGGQGGTGIAGPELAPVQQAVTNKEMNKAERGVNYNLQGQTNLLEALERQGGFNKQRAVYDNQEALMQALNQANGVGTQNAAIQGLQNTAGMYGNIASGQGPNPAMAMLNQQTGANIANQAALMAGQRGAGANAGLLARQASQQGGALQQNAVGQGATMQANQQLNALQGLANTQQAFGNIGGAQVGQLQGQQAAAANQANQLAGQQIAQTNQNMQAALGQQGQMQNALGAYNSANVANQGNVNSSNAGAAQSRMGHQGQVLGGIMNGGGAAMGLAMGGEVDDAALAVENPPLSAFGQALAGPQTTSQVGIDPALSVAKYQAPAKSAAAPAESQTMVAADAGTLSQAAPTMTPTFTAAEGGLAESGGHVKAKAPTQKAVASGDDYANDKIPAKLSEGEIVLPRSVTMSEDPIAAAGEFVRKTLAERAQPKGAYSGADQTSNMVVAEQPTQEIPQGAMPEPQAPVTNTAVTLPQAQQTPPPVAQPAPQAAPVAPPVNQPGNDDYMGELARREMDLASGAIKPKTYSDLYNDKSTLGKVGTIFGLMLSGAGSGLTGQPNALLHMMDKQIAQDLEAQKANKDKARNFISMEAERRQTRANTTQTQIETENKTTEGQQKKLEYEAGKSFITDPKAKKEIQHYDDRISQIKQQSLGEATAYLAAGAEISRLAAKVGTPQAIAIGQQAVQGAKGRATEIAQKGEAQGKLLAAERDKKIQEVARMAAPVNETKYNAAIYSKLLDPNVGAQEKSAVEQNRKDYQQMVETFEKLASMPRKGEAPGVGKGASVIASTLGGMFGGKGTASTGSEIGELAQNAFERERNIQIEGLASALQGRMTKDEIANLLPSIFDTGVSEADALKKIYEKFKNSSLENAPNLKRFGLINSFPAPPKSKRKADDDELDKMLRTPDKAKKTSDKKEEKKDDKPSAMGPDWKKLFNELKGKK